MPVSSLNSVDNQQLIQQKLEYAGAPEVEATVETSQGEQFEWNVEKLFVHNPEHSEARTWFVRIISLLIGIPTLILDLGRRIAFSLDLVNGKSFSLIDEASDACKAISEKVNALSQPEELTIEDLNENTKQSIETHAKKLIEGLDKINGGIFHTNNSFSSPYALEGEIQVRKSALKLVEDIQKYVAENAAASGEFMQQLNTAKGLVEKALQAASKDKIFVTNKVVYSSIPMRDQALLKFQDAMNGSRPAIADQFVSALFQEPNFVKNLKKGVQSELLTKERALEALQTQSEKVYSQGLERGIHAAEKGVSDLLSEAIQLNVASRADAEKIDSQIKPDVNQLAVAATLDLLSEKAPDNEVQNRLIQIAKGLQNDKRLKPNDKSRFLSVAEDLILKLKKQFEAEFAKAKEEADHIEAERVAAEQKIADQQSLFSTFERLLGLIAKEQGVLGTQLSTFDQKETERKALANQFDVLCKTKVMICDDEMTILQAADRYFEKFNKISNANLTPAKRDEQINKLRAEGFTDAVVTQIQAMKALEPKLTALTTEIANFAKEIEAQHDKIAHLRAVYRVFSKNHSKVLEESNRQLITEQKREVNKTQKALDDHYLSIIHNNGFLARFKLNDPSVVAKEDVLGNTEEVETVLKGFSLPQKEAAVTPLLQPEIEDVE